jgi:hypothetical protein
MEMRRCSLRRCRHTLCAVSLLARSAFRILALQRVRRSKVLLAAILAWVYSIKLALKCEDSKSTSCEQKTRHTECACNAAANIAAFPTWPHAQFFFTKFCHTPKKQRKRGGDAAAWRVHAYTMFCRLRLLRRKRRICFDVCIVLFDDDSNAATEVMTGDLQWLPTFCEGIWSSAHAVC